MAQNTSDELVKLLPTPQNNQTQMPQKLSMRFLHELILELKHDNIQLNQRLTEYEMDMATLLQSNQEVAAGSISISNPVESSLLTLPTLPTFILLPRAERHRTDKKYAIFRILLHSLKKLLLPRHNRRFLR